MEYEAVIGLEIHCQLKTNTKMFCGCPSPQDGAGANTSVCHICTGQPGVLPALNKEAVRKGVLASKALGLKINQRSVFARKNYFYPDCPKNYQITQYKNPLSQNGKIHVEVTEKNKLIEEIDVGITRLHLEEDAGKSLHAIGSEELNYSLIDFNRAGMPLAEIVSEPDMRSANQAYAYLTTLKNNLIWAGVSNCDMEKGELRVDVNISIKPIGRKEFGTRVELKNLNSFKAVKDAINYEIERQQKTLNAGGKITQETRLWDDKKLETVLMRTKEDAHDYRYFEEPDLPELHISNAWLNEILAGMSELPLERKNRYIKDFGLNYYDASVLTGDKELGAYFEDMLKAQPGIKAKSAANLIAGELAAKLNAEKLSVAQSLVPAVNLAELVKLTDDGQLSAKLAKDVFAFMWSENKTAAQIVKEKGLVQVQDQGQIIEWAKAAIAANPKAVADVKNGNEKAAGALLGFMMKESKGKVNPAKANEILLDLIKKI